MVTLEAELAAMVKQSARYQRVKSLAHAMGGRGSDPAAFYATGDIIVEWLATMTPAMRLIVRSSSMLDLHRHMTNTHSIRGVLAFDHGSIVEWKQMAARDARPRPKFIEIQR